MDELKNPFAPGAGVPPPELSGRDKFLRHAEITIHRATEGRFGKSFIAIGLRGVGKTVVLNRVRRIADNYKCKSLMIEMHEDKSLAIILIPHIRKILLEFNSQNFITNAARKALRVLKSFINTVRIKYEDIEFSLDVDPQLGVADNNDIEIDLPDLFVAIGEAAKECNETIVIILDEIQYLAEKELSAIVMALHRTAQEELPILLVGAGLPLLVGKLGKSKSYAERLFSFPSIDALDKTETIKALNIPAEKGGACFTGEALNEIYNLTRGYPYFIQEWGYVCWNIASNSTIEKEDVKKSIPVVINNLDESFFRVRFDRLTKREKQYLRAMAELGEGPYRSGDIAEILEVQSQKLGPCRSSLIAKGMIFSPSYGDMSFTVPLFDQYMKRTMSFSLWQEPD